VDGVGGRAVEGADRRLVWGLVGIYKIY
jgi:hypothetical protein